MATALLKEQTPSRVPIFISAQELARMMRGSGMGASAPTGDLLHMYIDSLNDGRKTSKETLMDAYAKRNAVLILDGLVSSLRFDLRSLMHRV